MSRIHKDWISTDAAIACSSCFSCIKSCPVKALSYSEKTGVSRNEELCIYCGNCIHSCSKKRFKCYSDIDEVKAKIDKKKMTAILDFSFLMPFGDYHISQVAAAVKKLGFDEVVDVSDAYAIAENLLLEEKPKGLRIYVTCSSIKNYILKYRHDLIKYCIMLGSVPYISAKIASSDTEKVLFTYCSSKKEGFYLSGVKDGIKYVVSMENLKSWLNEMEIDIGAFPKEEYLHQYTTNKGSKPIELVDSIEDFEDAVNYYIENHKDVILCPQFCIKGCMNNPGIPQRKWKRINVEKFIHYFSNRTIAPNPVPVEGGNRFHIELKPYKLKQQQADDEEIEAALRQIGKESESDFFNCGACGYDTCRGHAQAMVQGFASEIPCMPLIVSREKEKRISTEKLRDELDEAFSLLLPESVTKKLKSIVEYRDEYNENLGTARVLEVLAEGCYRHVINSLKLASDFRSYGLLDACELLKEDIIQAIVYHDIMKQQPIMHEGEIFKPQTAFEKGELHAIRGADFYREKVDGGNGVVGNLIRYHHTFGLNEMKIDNRTVKQIQLFQLIDGLSAGMTRRDNQVIFWEESDILMIYEHSKFSKYNRVYRCSLPDAAIL